MVKGEHAKGLVLDPARQCFPKSIPGTRFPQMFIRGCGGKATMPGKTEPLGPTGLNRIIYRRDSSNFIKPLVHSDSLRGGQRKFYFLNTSAKEHLFCRVFLETSLITD